MRWPSAGSPVALDVLVIRQVRYRRGMHLPFDPPLEPMLAKPVDELPAGLLVGEDLVAEGADLRVIAHGSAVAGRGVGGLDAS